MAKLIDRRRIKFPKGKQRVFLEEIEKKFSIKKIAEWCKKSERTIRDWRREKYFIDKSSLEIICKKGRKRYPGNIKEVDEYWYVKKGAKKGWMAVVKKYGKFPKNEERRKEKWHEWWEKEGKYKKYLAAVRTLSVRRPKKSRKLAEFIGIMLGDGGITDYQIAITLHSKDDKEYSKFVISLLKDLFSVPVSIYYRKTDLSFSLVVSRVQLVRFCINLGLKKGNKIKQQVDIPDWIKQNKLYSIACVRGLIDTDGCIFNHNYKVNDNSYNYKKLSFTSYSNPLRQSVFDILKRNGLNPRIATRKDVRLDSIEDIQQYFRIFGSHNPKHLKRYKIRV